MYDLLDNWITPWFDQSIGLYLFSLCFCIITGLYLLIKGGDWLSTHSSNIAFYLGVPPVVVGLTIVSIATSTPELFTSIAALRSESPGLILGNIIGSNIANVGLILGIALLIGKIPTKDAVSFSQRICLTVITLGFCLVLFLSKNHEIGFISGGLFLCFIFVYLVVLSLHSMRQKSSSDELEKTDKFQVLSLGIGICVLMLMISTLALWIGADTLVYGAKSLAELVNVPEELIGFSLLAIGTSLPELAASISLVRKSQTSMLLGNVVGSNLFNIALIGGLAGILGPVRVSSPNPWIDYISLLLITFILAYWLKGKILAKNHGLGLLLLYVAASLCTWVFNS